MENKNSKRDSVEVNHSKNERVSQEPGMRGYSLGRNPSPRVRRCVFILRASHVLVALAFLALALVEFALSPPYFDAISAKEPIPLKQVRFVIHSVCLWINIPLFYLFSWSNLILIYLFNCYFCRMFPDRLR